MFLSALISKCKTKNQSLMCIHNYIVTDMKKRFSNAGASVDIDTYYEVTCHNCGNKKWLNEYEFYEFKKLFIKENELC